MPTNTRYSIGDLARLADVTSRTIRYYIAQGLLASPDTLGPNARYTDGHLARLRLIRRLQREHLPLAEIRSRLASMTDADVVDLLEPTASRDVSSPPPDSASDYIRRVLGGSRAEGSPDQATTSAAAPGTPAAISAPPAPLPPPAAAPAPPFDAVGAPAPPFDAVGAPERRLDAVRAPAPPFDAAAALAAAPPTPATGKPAEPDRSTWERLAVTPDVEIHIRRPLDRRTNKQVDRLVRIARELLDDEP